MFNCSTAVRFLSSDLPGSAERLLQMLLGAYPLQEIASIQLLYANLLDGDVIEINEDATTPEHLGTKWWIKDLQLALSDRNALLSGKDLTEAIMNAVQMLLHHQFPRVKGLQDTGLSRFLSFSTTKRNAVQIFHVELRKL